MYQEYAGKISEMETALRQAKKVDKDASAVEIVKQRQDLLVDSLTERVKDFDRELIVLRKQVCPIFR